MEKSKLLYTLEEIMDCDCTPTVEVELTEGELHVTVPGGATYKVDADPIKVLGLLHHMTDKEWFTGRNAHDAIEQIWLTTGWNIHPF